MQLYQIREEILETDRITSLEDAEEKGRVKGRAEGRAEGRVEGRAEGRAEGIIEGEARGIIKGKTRGIIETARKFKQNNVSVDIIKKATGLSEEEIKKL